jgi:hypothetical protein
MADDDLRLDELSPHGGERRGHLFENPHEHRLVKLR